MSPACRPVSGAAAVITRCAPQYVHRRHAAMVRTTMKPVRASSWSPLPAAVARRPPMVDCLLEGCSADSRGQPHPVSQRQWRRISCRQAGYRQPREPASGYTRRSRGLAGQQPCERPLPRRGPQFRPENPDATLRSGVAGARAARHAGRCRNRDYPGLDRPLCRETAGRRHEGPLRYGACRSAMRVEFAVPSSIAVSAFLATLGRSRAECPRCTPLGRRR